MYLESMRELTNQVLEEEKMQGRSKSNRRGVQQQVPSPFKPAQATSNSIEQIGCLETPLGQQRLDYETRLDLHEGVELNGCISVHPSTQNLGDRFRRQVDLVRVYDQMEVN